MREEQWQVNIYRNCGIWAYALFLVGADGVREYDHSTGLDAETEDEARAEVAKMFPGRDLDIKRISDTNEGCLPY
jgi:hypothetical protein